MKKMILSSLCALSVACFSAQASAENNMLLILDASNSMWGQTDGVAKIESARGVLGDVLTGLPEETQVGIMAYGHNDKESCTDVAMLTPIGKPDVAAIKKKIADIKPKGKTPIAYSLTQAGTELGKFEGDNNHLVLISDGIETCEGDPCAVAESLASNNVGTKVHVVGFNVDAAARKQLECIAEKGGGKYYNADNANALKTAMAEVKKVAVEAPKKPELEVYFEDNFDGDALGDDWEVMNPNPDAYIVENGMLGILANGGITQSLEEETVPNVFKLLKVLPAGDWVATMRILTDVQTVRERYILGLIKDKDNMLFGSVGPHTDCCYNPVLNYWVVKRANGTPTNFSGKFLGPKGQYVAKTTADWLNANIEAVQIRYAKKGREYTVSVKIEGKPDAGIDPQWRELQALTSLRMPGDNLFIAASQSNEVNKIYNFAGGETLVNVDWIKIEAEAQDTADIAAEEQPATETANTP